MSVVSVQVSDSGTLTLLCLTDAPPGTQLNFIVERGFLPTDLNSSGPNDVNFEPISTLSSKPVTNYSLLQFNLPLQNIQGPAYLRISPEGATLYTNV